MNKESLERALRYIDSWITLNTAVEKTPGGMVVAIQHKDKIIYERAWGQANIERSVKMETTHRFRLASHSKMVTALAIMQLVEAKKLQLDDTLSEHLSWIKQATDPRVKTITIRNLLEHSSGLTRDGSNGEYWNLTAPFPTTDAVQTEILTTKLVFDPDTRFKYSNIGYGLLGLIVEAVSETTLQEYFASHIFEPLGMSSASADLDESTELATGYSRKNLVGIVEPLSQGHTLGLAGATGVTGAAADLCKFSRIIYDKTNVLSERYRRQMIRMHIPTNTQANDSHYGYGYEQSKVGNRQCIGHAGGFPGFSTYTIIDPEAEMTVVVCTNRINGNATMIGDKIMQLGQYFASETRSAKAEILDAYEGRYEDIWFVGDIINHGEELILHYPTGWSIPHHATRLVPTKIKDTFVVTEGSGFGSVGEEVVFKRNAAGAIDHILYAGSVVSRYKDTI